MANTIKIPQIRDFVRQIKQENEVDKAIILVPQAYQMAFQSAFPYEDVICSDVDSNFPMLDSIIIVPKFEPRPIKLIFEIDKNE